MNELAHGGVYLGICCGWGMVHVYVVDEPMNYLILILACWRISALLSYECGPWDIFVRFREKIGLIRLNEMDCESASTTDSGFLADLFNCVWCLSIWFAIIGYAFYLNWPGETLIVLSPFAISAGAVLLEKVIRG